MLRVRYRELLGRFTFQTGSIGCLMDDEESVMMTRAQYGHDSDLGLVLIEHKHRT